MSALYAALSVCFNAEVEGRARRVELHLRRRRAAVAASSSAHGGLERASRRRRRSSLAVVMRCTGSPGLRAEAGTECGVAAEAGGQR